MFRWIFGRWDVSYSGVWTIGDDDNSGFGRSELKIFTKTWSRECNKL